MFGPHRSDTKRRALLLPILFLLGALAACSSPGSVDRSVAASPDAGGGGPRTADAAPEATVGVAAYAREKGDSSGVPFITRQEASGGSS